MGAVPKRSGPCPARPRALSCALSLLVVASVAAACGDDDGSEATSEDPATSTSTTSTTEATTTTTAPTTTTQPPAADGTDLAACRDGTCEVQVALGTLPLDIPLDGALGVDTLTLSAITPDAITADGVAGGGSLQMHVEVPVGNPGYLNSLGVTLVTVEGDTAVVRLAPS